MNLKDVTNLRLINQQITGSEFTTAKEIVGWMGAMQAQDFAMAKWAIGVRLPGSTDKTIESALDKGEIIRTHLLRPTWHFVSCDDIYWMLSLTTPQIRAAMKSRDKQLELEEIIYKKSNAILEKALAEGDHLTRDELMELIKSANINTSDNRSSHLLMRAELDGIICSGKTKNNKQTYALLSERVPKTTSFNRDEALAKLAHTYFKSHGPATLSDFVWWSGLSVGDSKHALESVKQDFVFETISGQTYWNTNSVSASYKDSVFVLPAFDEFIIAYKDKTSALLPHNYSKAVSTNGIFRPMIVVNGQVTGIWKRTIKKDKVHLETGLFQSPAYSSKESMDEAYLSYGNFINKEIEYSELQIIPLK